MVDDAPYSDDISALWGPQGDSALEPTRAIGAPTTEMSGSAPGPSTGNGIRPVDAIAAADVDRFGAAVAAREVEAAARATLGATSSPLEASLTHHVAVALYELMTSSNDRLVSAEERLNQRLHEVAEQIAGQAGEWTARSEREQHWSATASDALRAEQAALRDQFTGPIDGPAAFQREMRYEVGRISDVVQAHGVQSARRAEVEAEKLTRALAEVEKTVVRVEARAVGAGNQLGDVAERTTAVQQEVAALRQAVDALRHALEVQGPGARRRVRRGRSG